MKAGARDHAHFRSIGEGIAEAVAERRARAARRAPGEKIAEALALSSQVIADAAARRGGLRAAMDPSEEALLAQGSLAARWRKIGARRG